MVFGSKVVGAVYDILRGVNATVWGGVSEAEKVGKIVKTGLSKADVLIGTSHALEDFGCNDYVCGSLDVIVGIVKNMGHSGVQVLWVIENLRDLFTRFSSKKNNLLSTFKLNLLH